MKCYMILFVAVTMLIKPLWPVAEYIMNYDYIANVLCENKDKPELKCDGKCYLAQMLAKESEQSEKNPFGDKQVAEIYQILHNGTTYNLYSDSLFPYDNKNKIGFFQNLRSFLFISKMVRPPEVS